MSKNTSLISQSYSQNSIFLILSIGYPGGSTSDEIEIGDNEIKDKEPASPPFSLSPELEEWIWKDNMMFLQDKNIFEHTYFQ